MFKRTTVLTRPTPARRDASLRGQGRSEVRDARTQLEDFFNILLGIAVG